MPPANTPLVRLSQSHATIALVQNLFIPLLATLGGSRMLGGGGWMHRIPRQNVSSSSASFCLFLLFSPCVARAVILSSITPLVE